MPSVLSIARAVPADPTTSSTSVRYSVTFSESVTGVDAGDFRLTMTGSVVATTPVTLMGDGASYQVVINDIHGAGTLRLDVFDDDSIVNASIVPLGGSGMNNGSFVGQVYTIEQQPPTVESIVGIDNVYTPPVSMNPTAPIVAKGDSDPTDPTVAAGGIGSFPRIPWFANAKCANGDILLWYEGRDSFATAGDASGRIIYQIRSTDNGLTWGTPTAVYVDPTFDGDGQHVNGGSAVIDAATGRIHLFFNRLERIGAATNEDLHDYYMFSNDNGLHWGSNATADDGIPRDLNASIKIDGQGNPSGSSLPNYIVTDAWGSDAPGPAPGIQLRNGPHAGRLILPRNHRYGPSDSTPWAHVIYSDDNGATWQLGGGPNESIASNGNSSEFAIAEYGSDGDIYGRIRRLDGTYAGYTRSFDGGITWIDVKFTSGVNGAPLISGSSCEASLIGMANGDMYMAQVTDTAIRAVLQVFKSTDGGLSWAGIAPNQGKMLFNGPAGYSALLPIDQSSILAVFEASTDVTDTEPPTNGHGNDLPWYEYLMRTRFSTSWVTDPTPDSVDWQFNEASSGPIATTGQQIKDHGPLHQDARGGPAGTFTPTGVHGDGTGIAVDLAQFANETNFGSLGGFLDPGTGPLTIEMVGFSATSSTPSDFIFDNHLGGDTGKAGMHLTWLPSGRIQWTVEDQNGTLGVCVSDPATPTSSGRLDDGASRNIRLVINAVSGRMEMWIDNLDGRGYIQQASNPVTPRAAIIGRKDFVLGAKADGTAGNVFDLSRMRVSRGVPASYLTGLEPKTPLNSLIGYTPVLPPGDPSGIPGLQLWLAPTFDGGYYEGIDPWSGQDLGNLPLKNGSGVNSLRDVISGRVFPLKSLFMGAYLDSDSVVGQSYRLGTNAVFFGAPTTLGTSLDFVQNTGVFTIACQVQFAGDENRTQIFLDNHSESSAIPGFTVWRNSLSGQIGVQISDGSGVDEIDGLVPGTFAGTGQWYNLAIVGRGNGQPIEVYLDPYPGGDAAPMVSNVALSDSLAMTPGNYPTTRALGIGGRADTSINSADVRIKNLLIYNNPLGGDTVSTRANVQKIANFGAGEPASLTSNASSVSYCVTFGQAVTGVDAGDFSLALTGSVTVTAPLSVTGSGSVYTVTVSGITGNGKLGLNLTNNGSIHDLKGNALTENLDGDFYTIDHTAPFVQSIKGVSPSSLQAKTTSVTYAVTFSEPVTGVNASDFSLVRSGAMGTRPSISVTGSGSVYTVTVMNIFSDSTVGLNLTNDGSIHDLATNALAGGFAGQVYSVVPAASVTGRMLFYKGSPRYDVTGTAYAPLPFSDDNAIATDKVAYIANNDSATFASISSYSQGINGIMIDLAGTHGSLSAGDFIFKVGNDNSPSDWAVAPAPIVVTVRANAGAKGSDRIELIWANNAIQKEWLEVIFKGNDLLGGFDANSGLATSDVFYFGSAKGDTGFGDPPTGAIVDVTDVLQTQTRQSMITANIPLTSSYDFNRDGQVNGADITIIQANQAVSSIAPKMIRIPVAGPFVPPAPAALPVVIPMTSAAELAPASVDLAGVASSLAIASAPTAVMPPAAASGVADRRPGAEPSAGDSDHYFGHYASADGTRWATASAKDSRASHFEIADDESLLSTLAHARVPIGRRRR